VQLVVWIVESLLCNVRWRDSTKNSPLYFRLHYADAFDWANVWIRQSMPRVAVCSLVSGRTTTIYWKRNAQRRNIPLKSNQLEWIYFLIKQRKRLILYVWKHVWPLTIDILLNCSVTLQKLINCINVLYLLFLQFPEHFGENRCTVCWTVARTFLAPPTQEVWLLFSILFHSSYFQHGYCLSFICFFLYGQVGAQPGGRCVMRLSRIITENETFSLVNILHDMCRMGQWSFWSWFDVNRSTFDEDIIRKQFSHFCS